MSFPTIATRLARSSAPLDHRCGQPRRVRIRLRYTVITLLTITTPPVAVIGQSTADTVRVADLVAIARTLNPMLAAARLGADAAAERVTSAGALPDPELTLGLMNRPVRGFGTEEPMTMNQVELSQRIPWPGKRGLARDQARFLATAEALAAQESEVSLISRVKALYFEIAAEDRTITISEATRELLRSFFQVSQARYATGETPQQDVLRAQVAVAQMTEEVTALAQSRIALVARLNALLGRRAAVPVGALDLPLIVVEVASVDSLMSLASRRRPALQAARERVSGAAVGYQAARRERYPDLMLSIAYGQRPQYDDMATLMIGVSLPVRTGSRQNPIQRERQAELAMTRVEAEDLANETFAALTEVRAEAERARSLALLYRTAILPQAHAAVNAALSAYRVGQVDYMTLVESQMTVNRYEIALVRLTAQHHQAVATIDALTGAGGNEP